MKLYRFVILPFVVVFCLDTILIHSFPIGDQNLASSSAVLEDSSQYKRQYSEYPKRTIDTTDNNNNNYNSNYNNNNNNNEFTTPTMSPPSEETIMSDPNQDPGNQTNISESTEDSQIQQQIAQEEVTLHRLIIVLCSVSAILIAVAVIIIGVYWQLRRKQPITEIRHVSDEDATPLSKVSENNGSISSRGDGVGASDRAETEPEPPSQQKSQPLMINQVSLALPPELHLQNLPVQHTIPSAPPAEKIDEYHAAFPLSPPAYTSVAPLYTLPPLQAVNEANHSVQDIILHTEGNSDACDGPIFPQPSAVLQTSIQTGSWHTSAEVVSSSLPSELYSSNHTYLQNLPSEQAETPQERP